MSNSTEEEIARDYICFGNADLTVVIVDATCLERNLNLVYQILEITNKVVVCVNLLDEAGKKGIHIDLNTLSNILGVPVVGTIARKKKTLENLMLTISKVCSGKLICNPKCIRYSDEVEHLISIVLPEVQKQVLFKYSYLARWIALKLLDGDEKIISSIEHFLSIDLKNENLQNALQEAKMLMEDSFLFREAVISNIVKSSEKVSSDVSVYNKKNYKDRDRKLDRILTSKIFGFPIMIVFLGLIFWITISGANYPSTLLTSFFEIVQKKLLTWFYKINAPTWLSGIIVNGCFRTVSWVVSVMLPPMAIFFPLFTLLEDLGYLPRIAFNLDKCFRKACSSRETSINHVHGLWL